MAQWRCWTSLEPLVDIRQAVLNENKPRLVPATQLLPPLYAAISDTSHRLLKSPHQNVIPEITILPFLILFIRKDITQH